MRIPELAKHWWSAAAVLLFAATQIFGHHAFSAEYDENKLVTITGTVTRFEWTNPHAWLYVDGKDENGKASSWSFGMGSPNGLIHRGWKRNDVKVGDLITVTGYAAKDGNIIANVRTVTLPDGRRLFGGFQSTRGAPVK